MMKHLFKICAFSFFLFLLSAIVAPVSAHTGYIGPLEFSDTGSGVTITSIHDETLNNPSQIFKGWAIFTLKNTSATRSWGDLHFAITNAGDPLNDVSGVDWVVSSPFQPTYVVGGIGRAIGSVVVNNALPQATLDMYFYANPLAPGETATFSVYTDNTSTMDPWFGLSVYPTPVPEPATLALLGLGGAMFFRKRR